MYLHLINEMKNHLYHYIYIGCLYCILGVPKSSIKEYISLSSYFYTYTIYLYPIVHQIGIRARRR